MSKFDFLKAKADSPAADEQTLVEAPEQVERPSWELRTRPKTEPTPKSKGGRPAGKRSDAATKQVTAYIDSRTHVRAKMKLLQQQSETGERHDFSSLVQQLLTEWIAR